MTQKIQIVKKALYDLQKHHKIMRKLFEGVSEPFQIKRRVITKENLWRLMLIDIQSRGGPKLNKDKVKKLKNKFFQSLDLKKAKRLKGEKRFNYLYTTIVELPKIGSKITSVFIKNMVCNFLIFPELKKHLFLPIDIHIKNILVKKLKIFKDTEVSKGNPLTSRKAKVFQQNVSNIYSPRVELDKFWYIGYLFCSKRSNLVCKKLCWIRKYCKHKFTA